MNYKFYYKNDNMLCMRERHSQDIIRYYAKSKFWELHFNDKYEVIGEIGNFSKSYYRQDIIITEKGKIIPIFPRGSLKVPFEWVAGYAQVCEDKYVVVVKSIIPGFLYKIFINNRKEYHS